MQRSKLLIILFASGAAAIVLLRSLLPSLMGTLLAAVIACGVIAYLGWLYWHKNTHDLNRAGDDLYYLGLLFTILSLGHALVALFIINPDGDINQRANELIGNFGIALASTVFGILGRIFLQGLEVGDSEDQLPWPAADGSDRADDGGDRQGRVARPAEGEDRQGRVARPAEGEGRQGRVARPAEGEGRQDRIARPAEGEDLPPARRPAEMPAMRVDARPLPLEELRLQIRHATDAFRHFTRVTTEQAEENRVHMAHQIKQSMQRMNDEARKSLLETQATWLEMLEGIRAQSEAMLSQTQKEAASSTQRTEAAWQDIARRAHGTSIATQESLDAIVRKMGETAAGVAEDLSAHATEIIGVHATLAQSAKKHHEDLAEIWRESTRIAAAKSLADEINACIEAIRRLASAAEGQRARPWARHVLRRHPAPRAQAKARIGRSSTGRGR